MPQIDIIEVISDALYSDSEAVIDAAAELLDTLLADLERAGVFNLAAAVDAAEFPAELAVLETAAPSALLDEHEEKGAADHGGPGAEVDGSPRSGSHVHVAMPRIADKDSALGRKNSILKKK